MFQNALIYKKNIMRKRLMIKMRKKNMHLFREIMEKMNLLCSPTQTSCHFIYIVRQKNHSKTFTLGIYRTGEVILES